MAGLVVLLTASAVVAHAYGPPPSPVAPLPPTTAPESRVSVEDGRLSVALDRADLGGVLGEIASRGDFELRTSGDLGQVTAEFDGLPIEDGLRRLAAGHELMLVYRTVPGADAPTLAEVRVFAEATRPAEPRRVASDLADIAQLVRQGQAGAGGLAALLASSPDVSVRARAALALGQVGGPGAEAALSQALGDAAPAVRIQAADALRRAAGPRAMPALQGLLVNDPEAAVRRGAARSLGNLRAPEVVAALSAAASDPDASVRREVARALRRHGVHVSQ